MLSRRSFVCTLPLTLTLPSLTRACADVYKPKLTNSKDGSEHTFPLGVLSATGRLVDGSRGIEIIDVDADGAAGQAGIKVGDGLIAVNRKFFPPYSTNIDTGVSGAQTMLAAGLNSGCADDPPLIELTIFREGKQERQEVTLPPSPAFARSFPVRCEKTEQYRRSIEQWLIDTQRSGGFFNGGGGDARDYGTPFGGLVLLAAGNKEYLPAIEKSVERLLSERISQIDLNDIKAGPKNWITASVAIYLAEYHLATGDEKVLEPLQTCCDLLAKRVSPTGTMGHHWEITYDGGGLTIINAHAHLAWALGAHCGCRIDQSAWARSMGEVQKAITRDGAVGYSSRAKGDNDAPARTGGMATALALAGQNPTMVRAMGRWLLGKNNRMRHAHTNVSMGLIFGTWGIKASGGDRALKQHLQNWQPYLELSRSVEGSAMFFPSKRNFGGDSYLGLNLMGNATVGMMLASTESNLFVLGGKKKKWLVES